MRALQTTDDIRQRPLLVWPSYTRRARSNVTNLHQLTSHMPHNMEIVDYCDVTSPYVLYVTLVGYAVISCVKCTRNSP